MTLIGRHRHCQYSPVTSFEHGPAARAAGKLAKARAVCYKNSGDACRSIGTAKTGMLGPSDPSSAATCPLSILEYRRLPQADATTVL